MKNISDSTIHQDFSNPSNLQSEGSVNKILLGLVNQPCQKRDEAITDELTQHLFQSSGFLFGIDLAAVNIQRGRDHGIPPFVQWREPCRLSPIRNWNDLKRIIPIETADKFRDLYDSVEDIDLFSAGLAEKPIAGGLIGPTLACIVAQQFRCLRKGDRFWYENPFKPSGFTPAQLQQIRKVTLAQVLCNTIDGIENIQPFVMLMADGLRNQRLSCQDTLLSKINLSSWTLTKSDPRQSDCFSSNNCSNSNSESRSTALKSPNHRLKLPKPFKTRINQQNRVTVQRPLGPHENLTIIINNHAVNAPVFVSDSIYDSQFKIKQSGVNRKGATTVRYQVAETEEPNYQPTTRPYLYPPNYQDPNNPNPFVYDKNPKYTTKRPSNNYYSHYPNRPSTNQNKFSLREPGYYEKFDANEAQQEYYSDNDESYRGILETQLEPIEYADDNLNRFKSQQENW